MSQRIGLGRALDQLIAALHNLRFGVGDQDRPTEDEGFELVSEADQGPTEASASDPVPEPVTPPPAHLPSVEPEPETASVAIFTAEWERALQSAQAPQALLALDLTPISPFAQTARIAPAGEWTA